MTKLSETMTIDSDGMLIVKQSHDFNPVLKKVKALKSAGLDGASDNKLVGLMPIKVFYEWAKKWGVDPTDTLAMQDVVAKEMMSSDNAHLRVWEGKY